MKKFFVEHPRSVNETYFTHMQFASRSGLKLVLAGLACIIHSILPFLFVTTASKTTKNLNEQMADRVSKVEPSSANT